MQGVSPGWKFVSIGVEGEPVNAGGIDLWRSGWLRCPGESIVVAHPSYPHERHTMFVYRLTEDPGFVFAAGEFSNGVWGFYLPEKP